MKTCCYCHEDKLETEFYHLRSRPDGLASFCKSCGVKKASEWNETHRDKARESQKRYRLKNSSPDAHRLRTYKLEPGMYDVLFDDQMGLCAICLRPSYMPLVVDHDHTTGHVRALLCSNCNSGLGMFGDDNARIKRAAQYLEEHKLYNFKES
jgi:hypothetical protein